MKTKIKTIDITALEWVDKINGNSYFAGNVTTNYGMDSKKEYTMPFQYGYGDSYVDQGLKLLFDMGLFPRNDYSASTTRLCREKGIILRTVKHENCRKAELKNI